MIDPTKQYGNLYALIRNHFSWDHVDVHRYVMVTGIDLLPCNRVLIRYDDGNVIAHNISDLYGDLESMTDDLKRLFGCPEQSEVLKMTRTGIDGLLGKCADPDKCDPKFREARRVGPHSSTSCVHMVPANRWNLCTNEEAIMNWRVYEDGDGSVAEDGDPWVDGGTVSETQTEESLEVRAKNHLKAGLSLYLMEDLKYHQISHTELLLAGCPILRDGVYYIGQLFPWEDIHFTQDSADTDLIGRLRALADSMERDQIERAR